MPGEKIPAVRDCHAVFVTFHPCRECGAIRASTLHVLVCPARVCPFSARWPTALLDPVDPGIRSSPPLLSALRHHAQGILHAGSSRGRIRGGISNVLRRCGAYDKAVAVLSIQRVGGDGGTALG